MVPAWAALLNELAGWCARQLAYVRACNVVHRHQHAREQ